MYQFNFDFYFGIYDSGVYWDTGDMSQEIEINKPVIQEVFATYGHHKSFKGWYISLELSRKTKGAITAIRDLGLYCKKVSGGLPVLISPWIDGEKAVIATEKELKKPESVSLETHAQEWDKIFNADKVFKILYNQKKLPINGDYIKKIMDIVNNDNLYRINRMNVRDAKEFSKQIKNPDYFDIQCKKLTLVQYFENLPSNI